ncbi:UNVERIFIED_ORG: hypothetical protein ABIB52_004577 [Arthrobacter sp. UYCu721]
MKTFEFQSDRSDALRKQLVEMSTPLQVGSRKRETPHGDTALPSSTYKGLQRRPRYTRRVLLAVGAASVGAMVLGQTTTFIQSAHAAGVLRATAEKTMTFSDPVPAPDEYLLIHTHANWLVSGNSIQTHMNAQTIDVYVPGDPTRDWVLDRDWGEISPRPGQTDTIHAQNGEFYGGPWTVMSQQDIDALPRGGQALLEHFDSQYQGGSASRDEDNFVRITDLLRTGLVPADLRSGLYEALALIPGVNTSEQKNFDGKTGIAIGRIEALRAGQRDEIIIDPSNGLVIGERTITTFAAFGFGANELTGHTAVDYQIVRSVPPANQPAGQ